MGLSLTFDAPSPNGYCRSREVLSMFRFFMLALVLVTAGCSSTTVMASWTNPAYQYTQYKKLLVAGITDNVQARQVFEATMAKSLKERGYEAVESQFVLPPEAKEMPKEELRAMLQESGYEGVLTMALARIQTDTEFRPNSYDMTHYNSFHSYYAYYAGAPGSFYHPSAADPKTKRTFVLEANFYDLSGKPGVMWNAQSKTVDPDDMNEFAAEYTKALVSELYSSGIIN